MLTYELSVVYGFMWYSESDFVCINKLSGLLKRNSGCYSLNIIREQTIILRCLKRVLLVIQVNHNCPVLRVEFNNWNRFISFLFVFKTI